MPIIFISTNRRFVETMIRHGFDARLMNIEDYTVPNKRTYYVSPANSLCFMDGGIDYALSRVVFPEIEKELKSVVRQLGHHSILGRPYLPIGSSVIIDRGQKSLVVAPTMLLPQNVANTKNAYYATMAVMYNVFVNRAESPDVDIVMTSMCCGYGKMEESAKQIMDGIRDFRNFGEVALVVDRNVVLCEPNLSEQPKYYQNTEFFDIDPMEIVRC
jgi:O-acetyl-ADP-ribose deacetylase (regulator of RNase III)